MSSMNNDYNTGYAPHSADMTGSYYPGGQQQPSPQYPRFPQYRQPSFSNQSYVPPDRSAPNPYAPHHSTPQHHTAYNMPPRRQVKDDYDEHDEYLPDAPATEKKPRGRRAKAESAEVTTPPTVESFGSSSTKNSGVEVKTKFPVARIKRIMQADEDVGKVAQVTPVAVSKALELFMISLVTKAAVEAKERSSKKVGSQHLKQAVLKDEQFDFLREIVNKVPDASTASDKLEIELEEGEGKKKRGGGRRKKKNDDDSP